MEQLDRRVRRTKKLLGDALIALTLEKEYEKITIQEITDRADIGYRTFFRHYSSKDELLQEILNTTMMELRQLLRPAQPEIFLNPDYKIADLKNGEFLFRHVQKHSDLYRVLMRSDRAILESIIAFAIQEFKTNFAPPQVDLDFSIDIVANHIISGTFSLVRWWLDNDMCHSPEVMGEYMFRLIEMPAHNMVLQVVSK